MPDPIGMAGGINLYAYTGNDPLNFTDPLGLQAEGPTCRPACYGTNIPSRPNITRNFGGGDGDVIVVTARRRDRGDNTSGSEANPRRERYCQLGSRGIGGLCQPDIGQLEPFPFNIWWNELQGGHVIQMHLFQNIETLRARNIPRASAFFDLATAEQAINVVLNDPRSVAGIRAWLLLPYVPKGPGRYFRLEGVWSSPIGYDQFGRSINNYVVVLRRNEVGFIVITAYPGFGGT